MAGLGRLRALFVAAVLAGGAMPVGSRVAPLPPLAPSPRSALDPVPVLLIPGWSDDSRALGPLKARLLESGWEGVAVETLSFEDPVGSNREHAQEIAEAVLQLREATRAERVDIVAHSMGGLATRYFLLNGGEGHVRRVAFLATPHEGTLTAHLAPGDGAREMEPGSTFLLGLRRLPPLPWGVQALTIRTSVDLHILPQESATLPGVPDQRVCCPTHAGLLDDDATFELIARFLKGSD